MTLLNGDSKVLYDAIKEIDIQLAEIKTKQEERHNQNLKYMKKMDTLPCGKHDRDLKWLIVSNKMMWIVLIVGGLATAFVRLLWVSS